MADGITVDISAHAANRLDQFGIRNMVRFRRFIRTADADYFDRKHRSKLVVINDHGHAVVVADDAGVRTVITVLPPPETTWSEWVSTRPDRYEMLDSN
jgi:hypothetical protein